MKLREIYRFELKYQLGRITPWLCGAILFVITFVVIGGASPADGTYANGPGFIALGSVLTGFLWLLIAPSIAGEAAARDAQTGMDALSFTLPLSKAEYLGGRFLAAFTVNALLLLVVPVSMVLQQLLLPPAQLGPFRADAYLTTYGLMVLPYAFAATAIQFCFALLARRAMAAYLASITIFVVSHFLLLILVQQLDQWMILRLFDLVGLGSILFMLENSWTPLDMNTRLVALDPTLLINRAIWIGIAVAALGGTAARFRFAHAAGKRQRRRKRRRAAVEQSVSDVMPRSAPVLVPIAPRAFGIAASLRQVVGIAGASFRSLARSRIALVLVLLFALQLIIFMPEYMKFMGVPMLPATERVLAALTAPVRDIRTPLVIITLLIAFCAGELYWRERDAGVHEITDATPVSEVTIFFGKLLGVTLLIGAWLAVLAGAAMIAQLVMGYRQLEPALYATVLLGLQLPEYLLLACLALVLHAWANHRYLGHVATLLAIGAIGFAGALGLRHNLLIYGASPAWSYSALRGFGASLEPWRWFKAYWAAWALLLALTAVLLWSRGREDGLRARLRSARARMTPRMMSACAAAALLVVGLGGFGFYNTNVLNEYVLPSEQVTRAAEYERRYARYEWLPQPRLAGSQLHVEIDPEQRAVDIRGTHRLVNRTALPIDSIHVATHPDVRTENLRFDRPATLVLGDEALGHAIYALAEPLQPGDSLGLDFEVHYRARGFANDGIDPAVAPGGAVFGNEWLPAIGYQPARQLRDAHERTAHGLSPRPSFPAPLEDVRARDYIFHADPITVDAVVVTSAEQVGVAPGTLRRTWSEGGRRFFHYVTDVPIRNEYGLYSGAYEVHEARWHDVAIEIYHHPGHTANRGRMVRSIQRSLAHYSKQFGPYPYRHIRFIERPGPGGGMSADASSIAYDEGFTHFAPDVERNLDLPFYIVAHEVAHQWWGSQLAPALVDGFWLMSESLAVFSGMQVLREEYGQEQVRRYLDLVQAIYQFPRARAAVPLLHANESFLGYRKGPVALYSVSRYLGEDRVNAALRRVLEQHAGGGPPFATSLDLYRELRAAAPDSLHPLLRDLFETNTFWELETRSVDAEQTAAGDWQVTLEVRARKVVVDTAGIETEVPMEDAVEIGVFAAPPPGEDVFHEPLYLRTHRIHTGTQRITLTVPREPERAAIDPHHLLIDLDPYDNTARTPQSIARSPDLI